MSTRHHGFDDRRKDVQPSGVAVNEDECGTGRRVTSGRIPLYQRQDSGLAIDSKGRRSAATPQMAATMPAPTMRAAPIR